MSRLFLEYGHAKLIEMDLPIIFRGMGDLLYNIHRILLPFKNWFGK